nr:type I polyketide synthase [Acidobacteriota bacterium]
MSGELSPIKKALLRIAELERENDALRRGEPIAVIGMSCRLPGGVRSPADFWRLLERGEEAIGEIPSSRWRAGDYYDADPDAPGKMITRAGGFLADDVYEFDPAFFGIAPVEAIAIDPQQRLLLELVWEAFEHAHVTAERLRGTRSGVFLGISSGDYAQARLRGGDLAAIGPYDVTGLIPSTAAGRVAYTFDLRGPAVAVDTACSSSLVALDLACASLRDGTSNYALAAAVNLILSPEAHISFSKMRALSPDGHCRTFDAAANGFVRSEGGGVLLLARLSDALRDGHRILAVIRGSAVNQDGRSNGLTAPNLAAQEEVVRAALTRAGVTAEDIDYIEAHGTGTPLGDPIELEALGRVFRRERPLLIGSVKTNLGHLETVAGMAGAIKLILALQQERIPRHLHFQKPSPHVDWQHLPFRVTSNETAWPRGERPRRAGISSFGFGGTNAHVIFEEAPRMVAVDDEPKHGLLVLSAKSEASLDALANEYATWMEKSEADVYDLAAATRLHRTHFAQRLAIVAETREELVEALRARDGVRGVAGKPKLAFVFTGQGSQYAGMGRALYERDAFFRARVDECSAHLGIDIPELWNDATRLDQTLYTQQALFALEYALAERWREWGIVPDAVLGHSIGELVAAVVAGVFTLPDACRLVRERARLMNELPSGGAMAAVHASVDEIELANGVAIAAINGPKATTLSGDADALNGVVARLRERGIDARMLPVSHAFHSPRMRPAADALTRFAANIHASAPRIPLIANVDARAFDGAPRPEYWGEQLVAPVRFDPSVRALRERGIDVFLELGPAPVLASLGREIAPDAEWLPSLRRNVAPQRTLL